MKFLVCAMLTLAMLTFAAQADIAPTTVTLSPGHALVLPIAKPVKRIATADPEVAETLSIDDGSIYVIGKKTGRTTLILWPRDESPPQIFRLQVDRDISVLRDQIRVLAPAETKVNITASGEQIILGGSLINPLNLQPVLTLARNYAGADKLVVALADNVIPQVRLDVKVAEVSKTLIDRIGARVNLVSDGSRSIALLSEFLSGSGASLASVSGDDSFSLDLEERKGLIKILAEPSILALSGEQGEFLAGGKLFIPVAQSNGGGTTPGFFSLEEREFGVGVKFVPTVLPDGRINLKLSAEVSEVLSSGTTISSSGATSSVLPTITSRKTATTIQLTDGQSFAVGGLSKDNVKGTAAALPGLGDLPLLGALFRSTDFQNDRSELIFVVTARLVKDPTEQTLPTDKLDLSSRGERILSGEFEKTDR